METLLVIIISFICGAACGIVFLRHRIINAFRLDHKSFVADLADEAFPNRRNFGSAED